jgi:hypothetical protein
MADARSGGAIPESAPAPGDEFGSLPTLFAGAAPPRVESDGVDGALAADDAEPGLLPAELDCPAAVSVFPGWAGEARCAGPVACAGPVGCTGPVGCAGPETTAADESGSDTD